MEYIKVAVVECTGSGFFNKAYYEVLFEENSEFEWIFLSLAMRNVVNSFTFGADRYNLIDAKTNDILTESFCIMANNVLGYKRFVSGKYPKCNQSYRTKVYFFLKSRLKYPIPNYVFGLSYSEWNSEKLKSFKPNSERFHDYSLAVEYLWDKGLINGTDFVPIIKEGQFTPFSHNNWLEASKNLHKDIMLLEFAYDSDNDSLLKKVASAEVYSTAFSGGFSKEDNLTNIASRLFRIAKTSDDLNLAISFYDKNKDDIDKSIRPHIVNHSSGGTTWDNINGTGRNFLWAWYDSSLRLVNINALKALVEKCPQIFKVLGTHNPFTGEYIESLRNITPMETMDAELKDYIIQHILPNITGFNYSDNGIWGYNAVTGTPIRYSQLRDVDSQKW